jgi:hypothetical protein
MARYYLERADGGREQITAAAYSYLIAGTAVLGSSSSDRWMELRLSEDLTVRTYAEGSICYVVLSTLPAGDGHHPFRVRLAGHEGPIPFQIAEARGRALRQVYALLYLIEAKRLDETAELLRLDWEVDLEELVPSLDRLAIESSAEGSWMDTVKKAGKAFKDAGDAAFVALAGIFKEGRQIVLDYARAVVALKEGQGQAQRAEALLKEAEALLKRAEAEKVREDSRRLDDAARLEAMKQITELYLRIDKEAKPADAELLKKRFFDSLHRTNPELALPPPNV